MSSPETPEVHNPVQNYGVQSIHEHPELVRLGHTLLLSKSKIITLPGKPREMQKNKVAKVLWNTL